MGPPEGRREPSFVPLSPTLRSLSKAPLWFIHLNSVPSQRSSEAGFHRKPQRAWKEGSTETFRSGAKDQPPVSGPFIGWSCQETQVRRYSSFKPAKKLFILLGGSRTRCEHNTDIIWNWHAKQPSCDKNVAEKTTENSKTSLWLKIVNLRSIYPGMFQHFGSIRGWNHYVILEFTIFITICVETSVCI